MSPADAAGHHVVHGCGRVTASHVQSLAGELRALAGGRPPPGFRIDLTAVAKLEGNAAALLCRLEDDLLAAGCAVERRGAAADVARLLNLHRAPASAAPGPGRRRVLDRLGRAAASAAGRARDALGFLGDTVHAGLALLVGRGRVPWRDVPGLLERAGADGLPIVLVINFLIGVTLGYQGSVQLRQFGAELFVADTVAIAVCRSLGPLMTAIIVAGRSGAAFAAELGTMKANEEIDALRTLGLRPQRFLVMPRLLALLICVPFLTLLGEFAAVLGGLLVAVTQLDLGAAVYLDRTRAVLSADGGDHVWSGLVKCLFFAAATGMIACQRGLAAERSAEGVGRSTTAAVVASLFALVVLESLFTVLFDFLGV